MARKISSPVSSKSSSNASSVPVTLPEPRLVAIDSLVPAKRNARLHSPRQIGKIADSLRSFGFVNPVLVDGDLRVLAGHGRLAAARMIGMTMVPVLSIDWLDDAQKRAYVIADNRLAELARWDRDLLALELADLATLGIDIESSGFAIREVELILDAAQPVREDSPPEPEAGPAVCRVGDLWLLGPHRLLCADALEAASWTRLMERDRARLVVTDPPYNVPVQGHVSGLGKVRHREFVAGSGELSESGFTDFLQRALGHMAKASVSGSLHYVFMDWRHLPELLAAGRATYDDWLNLCVWSKTNAGMGSLYRSQHELVAVFRHGSRPHVNNVALGSNGRYRTNVWSYAGGSSFSATRQQELGWHPTIKPVEMIADILRDASDPGDIVVDGFGGSGTTLIAAEQTGRCARLLELDPLYGDVILRRFARLTGTEPVLAATGETFSEMTVRMGEVAHG